MEMVMQYVWQAGLWGRGVLTAVDGRRVEVIDRGTLNTSSGPDFFNAKVRIDNNIWVGNIEIHVRASDWYRHGHDGDAAYDNVVLHVVAVDDCEVYSGSEPSPVAQVVMRNAQAYREFYERLCDRDMPTLGCAGELGRLSGLEVADWLGSLGYERLQRKADDIAAMVERLHGDWSEASYITLARGLGFGTNAEPMEQLARSVPLKILGKHADRPLSVEAILLGQAGLLESVEFGEGESSPTADYEQRLKQEYEFMAVKFGLERPAHLRWKTGGIRPHSSPWRRITLLAAYVCAGIAGGAKLLELRDIDQALEMFRIESAACRLTQSSRMLLLINVVIPLMYARCEAEGRYDRTAVCPEMLQSLPAEDNRVTRLFAKVGITARDALSSQAVLELYNNYCTRRRCLSCRFAHRLLAKSKL